MGDNSNPSPKKVFYTIPEAAIALNVSEKSIRRFIVRGLLKPSKALRKKLIPVKQIDGFGDATC
jgi:hypothetical protein